MTARDVLLAAGVDRTGAQVTTDDGAGRVYIYRDLETRIGLARLGLTRTRGTERPVVRASVDLHALGPLDADALAKFAAALRDAAALAHEWAHRQEEATL